MIFTLVSNQIALVSCREWISEVSNKKWVAQLIAENEVSLDEMLATELSVVIKNKDKDDVRSFCP